MTLHAAGESAQLPGACSAAPPAIAVALAASPAELAVLADELSARAIPHVLVREPDKARVPSGEHDALMAIGVVPMPRARVRRLLAHLPLVRGKADRE